MTLHNKERLEVLLAEDDLNVLLSLEFILKNHGYTVKTAQNGKEALEKIQKHTPQVIILDRNMPQMTGFEVAYQVKKVLKLSCYLIVLTAESKEENQEQWGVDQYLLKPYNPDKIINIIQTHIKKN
mgnify:CR=1 FL=1